jgi:hypothetical protein
LLIVAANCDDHKLGFLTGFLKSRVYAKLLMRLISERYQTFNRRVEEVEPELHDREDYKIGKPINSCAGEARVGRGCDGDMPPEKADGSRIRHGSFDHG